MKTLFNITKSGWYKVKFNNQWSCQYLTENSNILLDYPNGLGDRISFDE